MEYKRILLLTSFCVMACDGEIASEEVPLLKKFANEQQLFGEINIDEELSNYINLLRSQGSSFIKFYLEALSRCSLSDEEQILLLQVVVKTIYADNKIDYSEVKFFKSIRKCLSISDSQIISNIEGVEDYWLEKDIVNNNNEDSFLDIDLSAFSIKN